MKRLGLGLACTISFSVLNASTANELNARARAAYAAGMYGQAASLYASIAEKSPAVWYALGCCAYKGGSYAHACVMWQRTCALGGDADLRKRCEYNEQCAYRKLGLSPIDCQWWRSFDAWSARVPLLWVQLLFLLYWFVVLFFVYQRRYAKKTSKMFGVIIACSMLVMSAALVYRSIQNSRSYAVVVREEQVLYAGPGSDYPVRGHGACGQMLVVQDRRGEWYKVSTADGVVGWITRNSLMMVRP